MTGAPRATISVRFGSRGGENSSPSGVLAVEGAPEHRADVGVAQHRRGSAGPARAPSGCSRRRAASLTSMMRPWALTTSTPSSMPARIASIRARSWASLRHPPAEFAGRVVERPAPPCRVRRRRWSPVGGEKSPAAYRRATAAMALTRRASSDRGEPGQAEGARAAPRASATSRLRRTARELVVDIGQRQARGGRPPRAGA